MEATAIVASTCPVRTAAIMLPTSCTVRRVMALGSMCSASAMRPTMYWNEEPYWVMATERPASAAGVVSPARNAASEARMAEPSRPRRSCRPPAITLSSLREASAKKPPVRAVMPTSRSPATAAAAIGCAASKKRKVASSPASPKQPRRMAR